MEAHDGSQARSRRPDSSASSLSRLTPQSSNNSAANLLPRTQAGRSERDGGSTQEVAEGSSLLQERLREKRAARLSERRKSVDVDTLRGEQLVTQSSPIGPAYTGRTRDRDIRRPSSSGKGQGDRAVGKKGMGIKEMEETVSTLHKQNFDLKLELFHRRQRQSALEERLEAAEVRAAEQDEMQVVNEQLIAELEKRDRAIEEAMSIICALEEKVEKLLEERTIVQSFDVQYESDQFRTAHDDGADQGPASSPPEFDKRPLEGIKNARPALATKAVARMPSFLSEQSEGTEALRGLYLSNDRHSEYGLPKLRNQEPSEAEVMDSPRLSVLSESSFLSVYGEKTLAMDALDLDDGTRAYSPNRPRHRTSESIEKWVDDKNIPKIIPHKPPPRRGPSLGREQFMSLNDAVVSPLQRLEKMQHTLQRGLTASRLVSDAAVLARASSERQVKGSGNLRRTDVESFDGQQVFPPTPDTFSTIRLRKDSNDNLGQYEGDRLRDIGRHLIDGVHTSLALRGTLPNRPRSAGETITSRRGGHGWDTATQSDYTEYNSDAEDMSISDPWIATSKEATRPARIPEPNLFTFSDNDEEWGRDMMFNRDNRLPPPAQTRFRNVAGSSSDNTTALSPRFDRSSSGHPTQHLSFPLSDGSPRPNPPERRSSLAASPSGTGKLEKIRKHQRALTIEDQPAPSPPEILQKASPQKTSPEKASTRSRITSKLFGLGRSESSNPPPPAAVWNRSQSYNDQPGKKGGVRPAELAVEDPHASSATPPPISRYPRGSGMSKDVREVERPRTASGETRYPPSASNNTRRESVIRYNGPAERGWVADGMEGFGFGIDGAADEKESHAEGSKGQGKKWFGLGRSGSLRR